MSGITNLLTKATPLQAELHPEEEFHQASLPETSSKNFFENLGMAEEGKKSDKVEDKIRHWSTFPAFRHPTPLELLKKMQKNREFQEIVQYDQPEVHLNEHLIQNFCDEWSDEWSDEVDCTWDGKVKSSNSECDKESDKDVIDKVRSFIDIVEPFRQRDAAALKDPKHNAGQDGAEFQALITELSHLLDQ